MSPENPEAHPDRPEHQDIEVGQGALAKVTLLQAGDSSEAIYDEWSTTYEADLTQYGYVSPTLCARELAGLLTDRDLTTISVVDYGCGTGLVGVELAELGFGNITGVDLSKGMLDMAAEKQVYSELIAADLTSNLTLEDEVFDACICVGSMGNGHVAPRHISEMLRPVRAGGPVIFYMNALPYRDDDYATDFAQLENDGVWAIDRTEESNYMASLDRPGYMVVAAKP